jgi:hypothetical protein
MLRGRLNTMEYLGMASGFFLCGTAPEKKWRIPNFIFG